jgi:two-component system chemotaxis response regulator CheY
MSASPTIIIADRDSIFSSSLRVGFSEMGFAVLLPVDGPDAEGIATCTEAALVVLDVGLPGISGYTACARIRRLPGYRDTPIVLTALTVSPRMREAANTAVATALVCKPYSFTGLLDSIASKLPPDHPLLIHRPKPSGQREIQWGRPEPLVWKFGSESGLSQNKAVITVVRESGVRIPFNRLT